MSALDDPRVIRVLIVDDHPALQAGLWSVLRSEPGLRPVGAVDSIGAAVDEARAARADVVLADYRLNRQNGLHLCRRLKCMVELPRVLVYTAHPAPDLAVPALLAGADGVLNKSAPAEDLLEAIRSVAHGRRLFPEVGRDRITAAAATLDPDDLPIFGMMLEETPTAEIAGTLHVPKPEVERRLLDMIDRLQPRTRV
jgi:DNA-binding NarL/FixJ family response regulator